MPSRRDALIALGVAGVGGATLWWTDREDGSGATQDAARSRSDVAAYALEKAAAVDVPETTPAITFSYESIDVSLENDAVFDRVVAEPTDGRDGDRIRIDPAIDTGAGVRLLQETWGISDELDFEGTYRGDRTRFRGGDRFGTTILLAPRTADGEGNILVARADETDVAESLIDPFELERDGD